MLTLTFISLSTSAVIGIVFAVVIGIVAVGSFGGWLYVCASRVKRHMTNCFHDAAQIHHTII